MMATGMRQVTHEKDTLFTIKQVYFYACKSQIMPQLYPLSHDRNTAHHHNHTADTASIAPLYAKFNLFPMSASNETAELSA